MTERILNQHWKKYMADTVTIVTAFVDIGRNNWTGVVNGKQIEGHIPRDVETYFKRFERLTKLKNPIIVYTHSMYHERILAMRNDIKCVAIDDFLSANEELLFAIKNIQTNPHFINFVTRPNVPEYFSPEYVLVTSRKSWFVYNALELGLIKASDTAAWIDFGYCRDDTYCPEGMEWKFNTNGKMHMWCNSLINIDEMPIFEVIRTGEVFIQGCHVIGPAHLWSYMAEEFDNNLLDILNIGLTDDDQTLFLMAYRNQREIFDIHYVHPNSYWFMIFKDFHHE